jgi:hypothetical protein
MSGNNAFNKSMNGIVSLDTGGSTIEGDTITTDTINCQTINATTANLSPTINTSQIFTDFIATAANPFISILGDVKYNDNLYVDNIYTNLSGFVNINNTVKLTKIDSITPTSGFLLLTNHTGSINIGSDASILRLGGPSTSIRTTATPVLGSELCNKTYVDSVSGGSLLSATNIWTGASNTFNNILNVSTTTLFGKSSIAFTGGVDYNIVSGDINNIFMLVVNGGNPRSIQMPARKIGQIIIIRSIASVSNSISVSLISGGNFYNPGQTTTALFYSLPSGGTVSYLDNGTNWISF